MSAYDNPTIIKDDSAMAWAQAGTAFSDAFTQSFDKARKERDVKEKEIQLRKERDAKDSKEQLINKQVAFSIADSGNKEDIYKSRVELGKKGVSVPLSEQALMFKAEALTEIMNNNVPLKFDVVDPEKVKASATYEGEYNKIWANTTRMLGEGGSQIQAIANGTLNKTNVDEIEYIGNTDAQRVRNYITSTNLAFNKNIAPKFNYNAKDLQSGATVNITVPEYDMTQLKQAIGVINPDIINSNKIDEFIVNAKKEGIIEEPTPGKYNIIYNEDVNDSSSGEFYTTVPNPMKENDLEVAGIYNNKGEIQDTFFKATMYVNAPGNAGIPNTDSKVMIPKRGVNMEEIDALITKQVNTNITGLLASDLLDKNKLRGFMSKLELGTGIEATTKLLERPLEEQISILSKPIIDNYRKKIMLEKNIIQDKQGDYFQTDKNGLKEFNVKEKETKISARDQGIIDKATALDERISRMENIKPGDVDTFEYNKKNIMYDGKTFRIEGGLLNGKPLSKEAAIKYLKTGK